MGIINEVLLARITLTQDTDLAIFENIPQSGYTDLKIVAAMRSTSAQLYDYPELYINDDWETAATDYQMKDLRLATTNLISGGFSSYYSFNVYGSIGNSATANVFSNTEYYLPDYTSITRHKVVTCDSVGENNAVSTYMGLNVGVRKSNAAVSRLVFFPALGLFKAGSIFSIYGIVDATASPSFAPKAFGGDIIKTDGTYWYHIFTSTGTFYPQSSLNCDYAIVAGAGGGGVDFGGGGGAGGYRTGSGLTLSSSAHAVVVGAGGIGGTRSNGFLGGNGTASSVSSETLTIIESAGGGGGGSMNFGNPKPGGSGGGGYGGYANMSGPGAAGNTPATTPAQGYAGGSGYAPSGYDSNRYGGGGGGATTAGTSATSGTFGVGGSGATTSISGTSTTYATGGKGCEGQSFNGAVSGAANTGNGGQGGGENYAGGAGGSGIVIFRYMV